MKRIAAVLALVMVLVLAAAPVCFAGGLTYEGSTPKDGATGKQPANMAVKLKFSEDMSSTDNDALNKSLITIKDSEGNTFDFTIAHSSKKTDELWLVLTDTLASDTLYTVVVSSGITSNSVNTLSEGFSTTFKTRNTSTDSTISMVLMFAMMAVMIFMSSRAAKKQVQEEDPGYQLKQAEAMNPYKIAKQKNISVEEAKAICEKEKAKAQKALDKAKAERAKAEAEREAQVAEAQARLEKEIEAERDASIYRVKGPRSIKAVGADIPKSVSRARKAREEAAKAAERARQEKAKGKKSKKK